VRFLADECCPATVVRALRESGHDVVYALEAFPGAPDDLIATEAVRQDRIVVTEDYDFGELVIRDAIALPGLVILAFAGQPGSQRATQTLAAVDAIGESMRGYITLVGPGWRRRRSIDPD
jgi:predicted nuclease of predicted toxin-antitoxin system